MGDRIAVMNFGVLQQVGPPQELYERPVNKFVAGFIGSPAMNFINVSAKTDDGQTTLSNANLNIPVPDRMKSVVGSEAAELTAGIRPEHFEIIDGTPPGDGATIRATTDVVEFLGNEELLHVRIGEHDLVAIVDASHRVRPGDVLDLWVPLEKIHLFDVEEGKALLA